MSLRRCAFTFVLCSLQIKRKQKQIKAHWWHFYVDINKSVVPRLTDTLSLFFVAGLTVGDLLWQLKRSAYFKHLTQPHDHQKEADPFSSPLCPCRLENETAEHALQTCPSYNMLKRTLARADLPADMSQLQHAEEDTGQWRPPCRHVPASTCWEDSLANTDLPADMSQLQHVEEDSLASADLLAHRHVPATTCWGRLTGQRRPPCRQTCPSYNMSRKTHWPAQTSLHTDMSQLQHVEENSLASADFPADMSQLPVEESHLPVQTPWDMSQLQHVEEDSLASEDPPCRPSSTTLGRNWRGQLNSPSRLVCPCDQWKTKSKTLTKLTSK